MGSLVLLGHCNSSNVNDTTRNRLGANGTARHVRTLRLNPRRRYATASRLGPPTSVEFASQSEARTAPLNVQVTPAAVDLGSA